MNTLDTALAVHALGYPIALIPPGAKGPTDPDWPTLRYDEAEIRRRFDNRPDLNVGIILGDVIDFDCDAAESETDYAELFAGCPATDTPSWRSRRGMHRLFASDPRLSALGKAVIKFKSLEIRLGGERAAQTVLPPSATDGFTREWLRPLSADCRPARLPNIVVDRILESHVEKTIAAPAVPLDPKLPGDDFCVRGKWDEILTPHGWKLESESAGKQHWCRPGKSEGISATTGFCRSASGRDLLYCFSSNAQPLEAGKSYSKFAAYTALSHGGNYVVAAADLANKGYGEKRAESSLSAQEMRTDSANGRRLAARFGDSVRWVDSWRKWLIWDAQRWRVDEKREIEGYAKMVANDLWAELLAGPRDSGPAYQFVRATNSAHGIQAMVNLARSEPGIPLLPEQLDTDPFLLNVANGTVELRTGVLRPHDRADYLSKLAPVDFDPAAECPAFQAFLSQILGGDSELIAFLQRMFGYSMTGSTREQVLFMFHGDGANGKSTLINVVLSLMGDYALKASEGLLLDQSKDSHPTGMADLSGKRLAVTSETSDGAKMDEARVKELTGGEPVRARRLYQNYSSFEPSHKILISTNHRPRVTGNDYAIWRRIRLVPFNVTIAKANQDTELPAKLRAEYPGVLRWLVEGCLSWQSDGLGMPAQVEAATAGYRDSEDTLAAFITASCEVSADASVSAGALLNAYQEYSGDRITPKRLAILLQKRGFVSKRHSSGPDRGRTVWDGLRLSA